MLGPLQALLSRNRVPSMRAFRELELLEGYNQGHHNKEQVGGTPREYSQDDGLQVGCRYITRQWMVCLMGTTSYHHQLLKLQERLLGLPLTGVLYVPLANEVVEAIPMILYRI